MPEADVTRLLEEVEAGEAGAFDRLSPRCIPPSATWPAPSSAISAADSTLDATGLVHAEAYLRLVRYQDVEWKGRAHFPGAASQTMRRVLVDHARKKTAEKRKGEHVSLTQVGEEASAQVSLDELLAIDEALERLAEERPRWVRVVECRYFAGLTLDETASALDVSHATVSNDWRLARAWLHRELAA